MSISTRNVCAIAFGMILSLSIGFYAGANLGPWYWRLILSIGDARARMHAARELGFSDKGLSFLLQTARSRNAGREQRDVAITQLAYHLKPWELCSLFGELSDNDVNHRICIAQSLDYSPQHKTVLLTLRYELDRETNAIVRAYLVQSLTNLVQCGVAAAGPSVDSGKWFTGE